MIQGSMGFEGEILAIWGTWQGNILVYVYTKGYPVVKTETLGKFGVIDIWY